MLLTLLPDTHPALHTRVPDFVFGETDAGSIVADLIETMETHGAFGLAANQCGLSHRVFVLQNPVEGLEALAIFNPEIMEQSGEVVGREGCLTFPGLVLTVKRSAVVTVRGQNVLGESVEHILAGMHARGAQHEVDHLNGITFTKRVSRLKLEMAMKKLAKA